MNTAEASNECNNSILKIRFVLNLYNRRKNGFKLLFGLVLLIFLYAQAKIAVHIYDITNRNFREIEDAKVSVVILTYKKYDALAKLMSSVLKQKSCNYEIIVADNGCLSETKTVVNEYGKGMIEYLPLCSNPGYAAGNNAAVKGIDESSDWILFLNDDVVLKDESFIHNMVTLGERKSNAAAVGCKLLTSSGDEILESGNIVWNDGSASGFGRGRKDINASEFSYPMPVDYVSGTCLMVKRNIFTDYGGFQQDIFPNYYEDTDLQMHIQHDLHKEVWFQPLAIAFHDEHGTFGTEESAELMKKSSNIFYNKWKDFLKADHFSPPYSNKKEDEQKNYISQSG